MLAIVGGLGLRVLVGCGVEVGAPVGLGARVAVSVGGGVSLGTGRAYFLCSNERAATRVDETVTRIPSDRVVCVSEVNMEPTAATQKTSPARRRAIEIRRKERDLIVLPRQGVSEVSYSDPKVIRQWTSYCVAPSLEDATKPLSHKGIQIILKDGLQAISERTPPIDLVPS